MKTITDMELSAALRQIVKDCGSVDAAEDFIRSGEYPAEMKQRALKLLRGPDREAAMAVDGDIDDMLQGVT